MSSPGDGQTAPPNEESSPVSSPPAVILPPDPPAGPPPSSVITEEHRLIYSAWSGPMPSPAYLAQYDKVCPGTAKIIVDTFKAQSDHRRDLEKQGMGIFERNSKRGMIFAFILGLIGILGGVMRGDLAGTAMVFGSLTALVGAYLFRKKDARGEKTSGPADDDQQLSLPFPEDTDSR